MPTKSGPTFKQVMDGLKSRNFSPIYILMGDESYYIDKIADYIAENVMPVEERDFNQTVVFGSDTTAVKVCDLARQYPMMSEYQVVIVKEAQNIKQLDALEKYLAAPVKSTILVWCSKNGSIDKRKKVLTLAAKQGVVFESKKLRDYQLPDFINRFLKDRNATIEPKAAQMIADYIGADLNRMASELEKVLISLHDNDRRITPDIVEKEVGVSKDFNAFELRKAIVEKNVLKANQIIKYFDSNPKSGSLYVLLPIIFKFFQNLMIVHYAPNNRTEKDIADALDMKWGAAEYLTGMRNYSARKTMDIISKIREIDGRSKGIRNPSTSTGELMKELIFFILH